MNGLLLALVVASGAPELVDVTKLEPRWKLDIKYATADNFTHQVLYPVARCLLRPKVADMLVAAQRYLDAHHAGHVLLLKDCYRPVSVQKKMWAVVKGTPMQSYVADPTSKVGSVHNYGAAVDLTLSGPDGREVDMGTPYDHLGVLAEPRYEERFLAEGKISKAHVANRRILREAMTRGGGFRSLRNEWWHFDALQGEALRAAYAPLDFSLEALP